MLSTKNDYFTHHIPLLIFIRAPTNRLSVCVTFLGNMAGYLRRQSGLVQRLWASHALATKPMYGSGLLEVSSNRVSRDPRLSRSIWSRKSLYGFDDCIIVRSQTTVRVFVFVPQRTTTTASRRLFHLTPQWQKVISFNLSDIGEGIREVTVKEWFVVYYRTVCVYAIGGGVEFRLFPRGFCLFIY